MDETRTPDDDADPHSERWRPADATLAAIAVAALALTVMGTAVAASNTTAAVQQSDTLYDGFEDGDADGWALAGNAAVVEISEEGQYSLRVPSGGTATWTAVGDVSNANGTVWDAFVRAPPDTLGGADSNALTMRAGTRASGGIELTLDTSSNVWEFWGPGYEARIVMSQTNPTGRWTHVKLLVENGQYKFKTWPAGNPEPQAWNATLSKTADSPESAFELVGNEDYLVDSIEVTRGSGSHVLTGVVENQANETIRNVSVNVTQAGQDVASDVTGLNGEYAVFLDNGTYTISASKPGYFNETVNNFTVTADRVKNFTLTNKTALLDLEVRHYMPHGTESPYTVTVRNYANGSRREVTANSEVWSGDTSVVQVDQDEQILIATSDTSVDAQVTVNARYVAPNGDIYNTEAQVTVASMTVDNLEILPPVTRFTATISDHVIMVILIATGVGVAATLIATSFAGLAAMTAIMLMGWIMGIVPNGMAMVTVLSGMFIGLNVAGNVDYQVTRR